MKTQMTRAQLRMNIAEKRGWKWYRSNDPIWGLRWLGNYKPDNCEECEGEADFNLTIQIRPELPKYLNSMDAALPLLRELRRGVLGFYEDCAIVSWAPREGISSASGGVQTVKSEIGKEAEAVCLAWWQYKTGEVVELVEESQA